MTRALFLVALLSLLNGCVSWLDVSGPPLPESAAKGERLPKLTVVASSGYASWNQRLKTALSSVAYEVTLDTESGFEGPIYTHGLGWDEIVLGYQLAREVEGPTLLLAAGSGPMTAVPPYLLTFVTLGLWPTISSTSRELHAALLLPGEEPFVFLWRREEDLFAWLPVLPLTPFWAIWRATPWGDCDLHERALEELPLLLRAASAKR